MLSSSWLVVVADMWGTGAHTWKDSIETLLFEGAPGWYDELVAEMPYLILGI